MLSERIESKIRENIDNEVFNLSLDDFYVEWKKCYAFIGSYYSTQKTHDIKDDELDMSELEVKEHLSNLYNTDIDEIEVYYQGEIGYYFNDEKYNLRFYEDTSLRPVQYEILNFIKGTDLNAYKENEIKTHMLYSKYKNKDNWKDSNKEYNDNYYIAIYKDENKKEEPWMFDELFDYLENNHKDSCYTIYKFSNGNKVIYISKDNLIKIQNLDLPSNIKEDIVEALNKSHTCELCKNTSYVNIFPYIYDNNCGSVGRLYSCPLCTGIHTAGAYPDYNMFKDLNGDEKLELVTYAYNMMSTSC